MQRAFSMEPDRLVAFSDGVIAVIITIMVLDLKAPESTDLAALRASIPTFAAYLLSFVFVGIYWNNHHHMLRAARAINGRVMWANLHLLFWLSLVPFVTSWAGRNPSASVPTALYGVCLLLCAVAYTILQRTLLAVNGEDSAFARAVRVDVKGTISLGLYVLAIGLAFVSPWLADVVYVVVALAWFVPDRRFERAIATER